MFTIHGFVFCRCWRLFARGTALFSSRTMCSIQYSVNVSNGFLFNEAGDLLDRYRAARTAGFQFVECGTIYGHKLDDLVAVLEETQLKQVLTNSYAGSKPGDLGQVVLDIPDEEFEEGIRKSIQYAKAMGSPAMHIMAGKVPAGKKRSDLIPLYLRRLKWAAQECLPRHLTIVVEPIGPFVSEDYFLNNYGLAVDVLAELDMRNLKIMLDVFHFQQLHPTYDVVRWARVHRKSIGHIQIAQSPKRTEPHGKGDVDYAKILPALGELFPDTYFGLEYKPSSSSTVESLNGGKPVSQIFDYTG